MKGNNPQHIMNASTNVLKPLANFYFTLIWQALILLGILLLWLPRGFAAEVDISSELKQDGELEIYRSVFISDPRFGKDPFFPGSKRREAKDVQPTPSLTPINKNPIEVVFEGLELKGISLGANKRLAIINNYTFAEGEKRNVKVGNQIAEVLCKSIQERSVIIMINDRTRKELNLRDGL